MQKNYWYVLDRVGRDKKLGHIQHSRLRSKFGRIKSSRAQSEFGQVSPSSNFAYSVEIARDEIWSCSNKSVAIKIWSYLTESAPAKFSRVGLDQNSVESTLTEIWPSHPWPKFGRVTLSPNLVIFDLMKFIHFHLSQLWSKFGQIQSSRLGQNFNWVSIGPNLVVFGRTPNEI